MFNCWNSWKFSQLRISGVFPGNFEFSTRLRLRNVCVARTTMDWTVCNNLINAAILITAEFSTRQDTRKRREMSSHSMSPKNFEIEKCVNLLVLLGRLRENTKFFLLKRIAFAFKDLPNATKFDQFDINLNVHFDIFNQIENSLISKDIYLYLYSRLEIKLSTSVSR